MKAGYRKFKYLTWALFISTGWPYNVGKIPAGIPAGIEMFSDSVLSHHFA